MTLAESPLFREAEEVGHEEAAPVVEVLRSYWTKVLLAIGARIGVDVAFYTFVLFITTYVVTYLGLPRQYALNAVLIAAAVQVLAIPYFGHLSDRFAPAARLPGRCDRVGDLGVRLLRAAGHRAVRADRAWPRSSR